VNCHDRLPFDQEREKDELPWPSQGHQKMAQNPTTAKLSNMNVAAGRIERRAIVQKRDFSNTKRLYLRGSLFSEDSGFYERRWQRFYLKKYRAHG
jgi:hypothetical protein